MSKRKRGLGSGQDGEKELTHEEVWDDSELVNSWNEALREYKKYHSMHARGEKVENVLKKAKTEGATSAAGLSLTGGNEFNYTKDEGKDDDDDDAEAADMEEGEYNEEEEDEIEAYLDEAAPPLVNASVRTGDVPGNSAALPQAILEDSPLKNLMMSWYYAGYYTGLYEGQQMAAHTKDQTTHSSEGAVQNNSSG